MKLFVAVILALLASIGWAAETPPSPQPGSLKGEVLEVQDVDAYTYLRLKTKDGETWAAVNKAPISKGAEVTIENATVMTNFESKTLKKTFDRIVFGTLAGTGATAAAPGGDQGHIHGSAAPQSVQPQRQQRVQEVIAPGDGIEHAPVGVGAG